MIPKKGQGRYRTYLEALREINPNVRVCGYTATPYRLDGGLLHRGPGRLFTDVAYDIPIQLLVEHGYLSPILAKRPRAGIIDTSLVGSSRGDFKRGELEAAALRSDVEAAIGEAIELGEGRKRWLVFACGIAHAEEVTTVLNEKGVPARMVTGKTRREDRDALITGFRRGDFTALVNVGVLTTGFDAVIDLLLVLRPTQSTGLYVQIYGRGMRVDGSSGMTIGKTDCLSLDYGGNVERHGPINRVRPKRQSGGGEAPVKVCPGCLAYVMAGCRTCPHCEHQFPEPQPMGGAHDRIASDLQPLDFDNRPRWLDVGSVWYRLHTKEGKPPSLRVDYMCGMRTLSEWVCLQHEGWPKKKAQQWWLNRAGPGRIPTTVLEALERKGELREPAQIKVKRDGDYERVAGYRWAREAAEAD